MAYARSGASSSGPGKPSTLHIPLNLQLPRYCPFAFPFDSPLKHPYATLNPNPKPETVILGVGPENGTAGTTRFCELQCTGNQVCLI